MSHRNLFRPGLAAVFAGVIAIASIPGRLAAQPLERFDTDRPDLSQGAEPVGRGVWQLETGWGATWSNGRHSHALGEGLVRRGLTRTIEARLDLPSVEWETPADGSKPGLGDAGFGIKVGTAGESGRWALGAVADVIVPSGARGRRAEAIEPTVVAAAESQLDKTWGLGANLGLSFPRQAGSRTTDAIATLGLGADLSARLALFIEYAGTRPLSPGGPWSNIVDGGASFAVARGVQMDASLGRAIPSDASTSTQLGVSHRW